MLEQFKSMILGLRKSQPTLYFFLYSAWLRRDFRFNKKRILGKNNKLTARNVVLNGVQFDIAGSHNCIVIESMAMLDRVKFHIRGNGNKVFFGANCSLANSIIWIEDDMCEVRIGRQTTMGGVHLAATENHSKLVIGEDCMLAYDIDIRTGDSHGIFNEVGSRINGAKDVVIGNHVWIAAHSIILKGATIGAGSVVATGAVVPRGDYPTNCILAGNPAKPVKKGIRWSRSRLDEILCR